MAEATDRAGRYVKQLEGYRAFIPFPLPPNPPVAVDATTLALLSRADQQLGRLDGLTQTLPNPDLFVAMYVRREAVLSSQIEGTQSTLDDVLAFELDTAGRDFPQDVEEVVNYVRAMNYGLARLATLPLSLRLLREIHAELMQGTRGGHRYPGEFRRTQNWIGPAGAPLSSATFVPPPVHEMNAALTDLERFLHEADELPALIHAALAHAQFETIHPFVDGNGRVGRLLITFLLCHRGVLHRPLLYLSHYLKRYRADYYALLMAVREEGDWESWIRFFVSGVEQTANEATVTARAVVGLRDEHRERVPDFGLGLNGFRLIDLLFERPLVNVNLVKDALDVSFVTANRLVERFASEGFLEEVTGGRRNRVFRYSPYLRLFADNDETDPEPAPVETTGAATDAAPTTSPETGDSQA
ncbi:MAG TPA: Fic family protein [Acidimicrobiia bacterium]|nr:Fic family protein [Acidimicrobiia bacterium]